MYQPGKEDQFSQHSFCTCTYLLLFAHRATSTISSARPLAWTNTVICIIVHYLCTYSVSILALRDDCSYSVEKGQSTCRANRNRNRYSLNCHVQLEQGLPHVVRTENRPLPSFRRIPSNFKLYIICTSFFINSNFVPSLIKTRSFHV